MEFVVNLFEMMIRDVGIDLGGRNIGVAEQGLNRTKVCAIHEKVRSEGMPERVWTDMLGDAGHASIFFDDAFDRASGEAAMITRSVDGAGILTIVQKESRKRITACAEVFGDAVGGGFGNKDWTVFAAFTTNHEFASF